VELRKSGQKHQLRRIPIVDADGACIGIVSQADLALKDKPERVSKTVAEISKPESSGPIADLTGVCSTKTLQIQRAGQVAAIIRNPLLFLDGGADSAFEWQGQQKG
jgi:CBS-domain-containing membrane protein